MSVATWPSADIVKPENRSKLNEWFKSYAKLGAGNNYASICRNWERAEALRASALEDSKVNNDPSWA